MSWGLNLTAKARADLRALDVWLQEEVLDELDYLADDPPRPRSASDPEIVHDFERTKGGVRHVVFLRCWCDAANATLAVLRIADCPMPPRT